jgi:hypothetical protein
MYVAATMAVSLTPALQDGEGDWERAARDFHANHLTEIA